jgi:hypothetical protein
MIGKRSYDPAAIRGLAGATAHDQLPLIRTTG